MKKKDIIDFVGYVGLSEPEVVSINLEKMLSSLSIVYSFQGLNGPSETMTFRGINDFQATSMITSWYVPKGKNFPGDYGWENHEFSIIMNYAYVEKDNDEKLKKFMVAKIGMLGIELSFNFLDLEYTEDVSEEDLKPE
jgi:hypothetical protein